jgi:TonB family protein
MKQISVRAWSALALAGLVWPAALPGQEPAPTTQPAASAGWEVNWGEQYCMLIRNAGGGRGKAFVLRRVPGSGPTDLITIDPSPPRDPSSTRRELSIVLRPSGQRVDGRVIRAGRVPSGNTVIEMNGGDELLDHFAESTGIELAVGDRTYFQMSYPLPTSALAALRQCEDDALIGWGIDPALVTGIRTRARRINRDLIMGGDYPAEAIRAHQEGVTLARLIVDTEGRVEDCAIVGASGAAALDAQTCALAQRRGRFRPATGADGQPMRSVFVLRVVWLLPR